MLTIVAFVVALSVLIAVHEYGHYRVAVACGVKVLRFSIGFGKTLLKWRPAGSPTEFVIGAFPLGGYVKMLDEREAPVAPEDKHRAFNTQPLRSRVAIVAAGPFANLLLAVVLYSIVNWTGVEQPKALLSKPLSDSVAERVGLQGGELVLQAGFENAQLQDIQSFEDVRWLLTRGVLEGQNVRLVVSASSSLNGTTHELVLPLEGLDASTADAKLFRAIGITAPLSEPMIGEVMPDGAAARAGLENGDVVKRVGDTAVVDGQQLRDWIRATGGSAEPAVSVWVIERGGKRLEVPVQPERKAEGASSVGRIGAYVGSPPALVTVRYGVLDGLWSGVVRTWEVSALTLRMMGKMLSGEASLKNLSGPLTIADYAGKSASVGLTSYLIFLALISVSLGVLNLLPLPVLDGGHLMYYLWEGLTGRAVSDVWLERMQRGGVAVLMVMMLVALFNDFSRILG